MRISVLQQREPFGAILEGTLAEFCRQVFNRPATVEWREHGSARARPANGGQLWLCNPYLNAIFVPQANRAIFDPIRREFSRSVVAWRRLAQRAYVHMSLSRAGAPLAAQASLRIAPGLPNAEQLLIIPGNHKIRVLDYASQSVYGIVKQGFSADFMQREVEARRAAEALGLPVPALQQVGETGLWFKERYLSGTPINRLASDGERKAAEHTAVAALQRLLSATMREEGIEDYVARQAATARALIAASHLLSNAQRDSLLRVIGRIQGLVVAHQQAMGGKIQTALTHGDFQPGNILQNQEGTWLIDWEYSARRQSGYDALVLHLGERAPQGLAQRIHALLAGTEHDQANILTTWPGLDWHNRQARQIYLAVFLLEELVLHMQENANSLFRRPGQGLLTLEHELWPALQAASA